jgi:hypothetical protein
MSAVVTVTVLPQNKKVDFERDKIDSYGTRTVLNANEVHYIFYEGQEIEVAETYEQLKEIIK